MLGIAEMLAIGFVGATQTVACANGSMVHLDLDDDIVIDIWVITGSFH